MKRSDYKDCVGLYLLLQNKTVVYVGMSECSVLNRIFGDNGLDEGHVSNKIFNKIKLIDLFGLKKHEIISREIELINNFSPYYNIVNKKFKTEINKDVSEIIEKERNLQVSWVEAFYKSTDIFKHTTI